MAISWRSYDKNAQLHNASLLFGIKIDLHNDDSVINGKRIGG